MLAKYGKWLESAWDNSMGNGKRVNVTALAMSLTAAGWGVWMATGHAVLTRTGASTGSDGRPFGIALLVLFSITGYLSAKTLSKDK